MVGGIIGICHNKHIVTFVYGAHAVVTDDDAPMPAPIDVFYNNRGIIFQITIDKFKEILITVGSFIFDGGMNLPTDFFKVVYHAFSISADCFAAAHDFSNGQLIIKRLALVIFYYHICSGRTTCIMGDLLRSGKFRQNGKMLVRLHIIKIRMLKIR